MTSFFAFLHHIAAFALVAALAIEFVLIRGELTLQSARNIRRADMAFGAASGIVLAVGLLRVFFFEKDASYYWHSAPFLGKLGLFVAIGLLSIYPTMEFASWRKPLREGRLPELDARKLKSLRSVIHWELAGIVVLILCAVLMARGIGYFG